MSSFSPIRSVTRALDVLAAMNRHAFCALETLHQQTRIPKPTLVRILETLQSKGMVSRGPQYGTYCLTSEVKTLSAGYHGEPRLIEAAAAPAEALTRKIKWPLALAVPDYDAVVVRYSTIPHSPLALLHSTLNMRLSLVGRALGRAYLAFCSREERKALLDILRMSTHEEDQVARNAPQLQAMLKKTRQQGYALRAPGIRPVSGTLALPIMEGPRVVATVGMTWMTSAISDTQAIERYLQPLQALSEEISERLRGL
jgi:IclR family mhp operon transcriptional activator